MVLNVKNPRIISIFAIFKKEEEAMEQMQFSAVLLMTLLTLALIFLLPKWSSWDPAIKRARQLMICSTGLLALHFILQLVLHLRARGVTQAVMLNLLMFVPCSFLFYLTMVSLLRRGKFHRYDWLPGLITWIIIIGMLVTAHIMDGESWLAGSAAMHWAEIGCSIMYVLIQIHFTYLNFREIRRIRRELKDYYDQDRTDMLHWMKNSILVLAMLAITVPIFIYVNGWPLVVYGSLFLGSIFYLVFSFACYAVSNNSRMVLEAEHNAEEAEANEKSEPMINPADQKRVDEAVKRWIANGKHLRNGLTVQQAADEMHVPRYQLTAWIKANEKEQFSSWLTRLRLEEAKQQMQMHPEWSNDVIAEHCGFGSRTYFQTVFRKYTGMTPSAFIDSKR